LDLADRLGEAFETGWLIGENRLRPLRCRRHGMICKVPRRRAPRGTITPGSRPPTTDLVVLPHERRATLFRP
jgi:hypothetical protein